MADKMQLPPFGGPAGYSAVTVQPGPQLRRAVLVAVLLIAAGAALGLLGALVWAAEAPRVVYRVYTLSPPTAYAINAETSAFIAADGIYTFIALGGGALLGLAGYLFGVRRYGPVPLVGVVAGAVAAAFLTKWLGNVLTGGQAFNATLSTSKPGDFLRAPIALGAHAALAFWPVAAALVAGFLELVSVMRARRVASAATVRPYRGRTRQPGHSSARPAFPPPPPAPMTDPGGSGEPWPGGQASPPPGRYGHTGSGDPWPGDGAGTRPGGHRRPASREPWPPAGQEPGWYEPADADQHEPDWPVS